MLGYSLSVFLAAIITLTGMNISFKQKQLEFPRVKQAYNHTYNEVKKLLEQHNLKPESFHIYLRAFKAEKELELWAKQPSDKAFIKIKTYPVCQTSGEIGPKRRQGDGQIPEGFYTIDRFNPWSNYHLSLGLNYPNKSDKILGFKNNLGGDIFIHGDCVTIGCLPITDELIEELYVFCVEAKNNAQANIQVTLYPCKLKDKNYNYLQNHYPNDKEQIGLWKSLKEAYDIFNERKQLPEVKFLENGTHIIEP